MFYPEITKFPKKIEMPKIRSPAFKKRPFGVHDGIYKDKDIKDYFNVLGSGKELYNKNKSKKIKTRQNEPQKSYGMDEYKMLSLYLELSDKNCG